MRSIVVAGFPGIGKTHLSKMSGDKIIDVSVRDFPKDDFPESYVDYVQSLFKTGKMILISTHRDVLMEIERVGIDYVLVYPERGLKDEYINRCKNNGSSQGFISKLDKNWDLFMKNVDYAMPNKRIVLKSGEFILDKLTMLYL